MNNMTIEWIKAYYLDIKTVSLLIEDDNLTPVVAFHCEQAVEKLFKACFVEMNINIPKTHDIRRLHKLIEHHIRLTEEEIDVLLIMNDIYIESRYPGDLGLLPNGKPTKEDAKMFYDFAIMIFSKICDLLSIDKKDYLFNHEG